MCNVIIIGAGGHAKVIADITKKSGDNIVGFLDIYKEKGDFFLGYPVLGKNEDYVNFLDCHFIIAIGDSIARERISMAMNKVKWYSAISPHSIISTINVQIGHGCAIMPNAVINSNSTIGNHCIVNTSATVEHDNNIEDFAHISVGVKLGGHVQIGKHSWIGIGATIKNNISICSNCTIGAGATVVKNIEEPNTYIGIPAKPMCTVI